GAGRPSRHDAPRRCVAGPGVSAAGSPGCRPPRRWRYNVHGSHRTHGARSRPMNALLLSMPDSFEHMPAVAIRMPNGALSSLAGTVDPHHRAAVAALVLVPDRR